jgi:hypothetical protein
MLNDLLATYLNVAPREVERLLALSPQAIYQDKGYLGLVGQLNSTQLNRTAEHAYEAYNQGLPPLKEQYGLSDSVMSGYTLCNWVLGFLMYPEQMRDMLERHAAVPTDTVAAMLPELIQLLDTMPAGRDDWQRALIVFSLPLLARQA